MYDEVKIQNGHVVGAPKDIFVTPDVRAVFSTLSDVGIDQRTLLAYDDDNSFAMTFVDCGLVGGPEINVRERLTLDGLRVLVLDSKFQDIESEVMQWEPGVFLLLVGRTYKVMVGSEHRFDIGPSVPSLKLCEVYNRHATSYSARIQCMMLGRE